MVKWEIVCYVHFTEIKKSKKILYSNTPDKSQDKQKQSPDRSDNNPLSGIKQNDLSFRSPLP